VLRGDVTAGLRLVLNEAKGVPARFVFVRPATAAKGDERRVASLPSPQHHRSRLYMAGSAGLLYTGIRLEKDSSLGLN
jgi:hypothetical protein